jgi:hypothetical protein
MTSQLLALDSFGMISDLLQGSPLASKDLISQFEGVFLQLPVFE